MRYLVSVRPEVVVAGEDGADDWAPNDEPVIPSFPAPQRDMFLSVTSFKDAPYAKVVDDPGLDPDTLLDRLVTEYPGLPEVLHAEYIMAIARVAATWPVGTKFQAYITQDEARLRPVMSDQMITLWEKQPLL